MVIEKGHTDTEVKKKGRHDKPVQPTNQLLKLLYRYYRKVKMLSTDVARLQHTCHTTEVDGIYIFI